MRRLFIALLVASIPLLSGCSVYARDAYGYDGFGASAYAVVPGPVYYGGGYRSYGPSRRPYVARHYSGHSALRHPAAPCRGGYGRRSGHR